jgi:triosephosphate isomerase
MLYGASVKPGNVRSILALPSLSGGLVRGASLAAADCLAGGRGKAAPPLANPSRTV